MTTTTTLNGSTLPNPSNYSDPIEDAGEWVVMGDGSYEYRFCSTTGVRYIWDVEWGPLSLTDAGTIQTAWLAGKTADIVWKPPHTATTYNVRAIGAFGGEYFNSFGTIKRTVRITLHQADP